MGGVTCILVPFSSLYALLGVEATVFGLCMGKDSDALVINWLLLYHGHAVGVKKSGGVDDEPLC